MAKVYSSAVIPAPANVVWTIVRDFNALPKWTPFVVGSRIEQNRPSDQIGCIRNFNLNDGGRIRERLLALSDYEMSFEYSILESPMGVENYIATFRLIPLTDSDHTFAEWTAEFDAAPDREDGLVDSIGRNVFAVGLAALKARFNR
jgi:Polyketide cyclase / dehydrase and lipid transport